MLAIFHEAFANPPDELHSPVSHDIDKKPKLPEETLQEFLSAHPNDAFSLNFGNAAALAYVRQENSSFINDKQRRCPYVFTVNFIYW